MGASASEAADHGYQLTREQIAVHEAGHAVVAILHGWEIDFIRIEAADGEFVGGRTRWAMNSRGDTLIDPYLYGTVLMAGFAAMELRGMRMSQEFRQGSDDYRELGEFVARQYISRGVRDGRVLQATLEKIITHGEEQAARILRENQAVYDALVEQLLEDGEVDGIDAADLFWNEYEGLR